MQATQAQPGQPLGAQFQGLGSLVQKQPQQQPSFGGGTMFGGANVSPPAQGGFGSSPTSSGGGMFGGASSGGFGGSGA